MTTLLISNAKSGWKKAEHIPCSSHAEAVKLARQIANLKQGTRCKILGVEKVTRGKTYSQLLQYKIPVKTNRYRNKNKLTCKY